MKKYFKKINITVLSLFILFLSVTNANAALLNDTSDLNDGILDGNTEQFVRASNFNPTMKIGDIAAAGIKAFLGLLGIIFVFLFVLAGYKYMSARGDEAKVEEALSIMRRAIIGLIIVIAAYSITYYVFSNLGGNTTNVGGSS